MTDTEKELLQAKHRLEEAQARDRVKERKARTHRLIQIGAIFVKACPELAYSFHRAPNVFTTGAGITGPWCGHELTVCVPVC